MQHLLFLLLTFVTAVLANAPVMITEIGDGQIQAPYVPHATSGFIAPVNTTSVLNDSTITSTSTESSTDTIIETPIISASPIIAPIISTTISTTPVVTSSSYLFSPISANLTTTSTLLTQETIGVAALSTEYLPSGTPTILPLTNAARAAVQVAPGFRVLSEQVQGAWGMGSFVAGVMAIAAIL